MRYRYGAAAYRSQRTAEENLHRQFEQVNEQIQRSLIAAGAIVAPGAAALLGKDHQDLVAKILDQAAARMNAMNAAAPESVAVGHSATTMSSSNGIAIGHSATVTESHAVVGLTAPAPAPAPAQVTGFVVSGCYACPLCWRQLGRLPAENGCDECLATGARIKLNVLPAELRDYKNWKSVVWHGDSFGPPLSKRLDAAAGNLGKRLGAWASSTGKRMHEFSVGFRQRNDPIALFVTLFQFFLFGVIPLFVLGALVLGAKSR